MSNTFLDKIRENIEERVRSLPEVPDGHQLKPNVLKFCDAFKAKPFPMVIAEIKFASPSRGEIYPGKLNPASIARQYLSAGASALSVLAEPNYFKGHIDYIEQIRLHEPGALILLKDFILSKKQIAQGLEKGANAVLLIVAFLDQSTLKELYTYACSLGLTPIIEVHNQDELKLALELSPKVIGINNRNLKTLETSLDTARTLIHHVPEDCYALCESGIESREKMDEMVELGFDGFLIGSSLMRYPNPGNELKHLLGGIEHAS